jgi:hypothetical protein
MVRSCIIALNVICELREANHKRESFGEAELEIPTSLADAAGEILQAYIDCGAKSNIVMDTAEWWSMSGKLNKWRLGKFDANKSA